MKLKAILRLGLMVVGVVVALAAMGIDNPASQMPKLGNANVNTARQSFTASENPNSVPLSSDSHSGGTVYVCKSAGAKKYHYKETCRGLSACTHEVVKMDKSDAEGKGLGLCGWED